MMKVLVLRQNFVEPLNPANFGVEHVVQLFPTNDEVDVANFCQLERSLFPLFQFCSPLFNKQRHSVMRLFHTGSRDFRISCMFQFRNQTPTVTACGAYCVIVGSIFDANQQNKTRLVNLFYRRDVITIAKLKTWAPCGIAY